MDIKRYSQAPFQDRPMMETIGGDWCKYEDIEVVLQVLKSNIADLLRELREAKSELQVQKSINGSKP